MLLMKCLKIYVKKFFQDLPNLLFQEFNDIQWLMNDNKNLPNELHSSGEDLPSLENDKSIEKFDDSLAQLILDDPELFKNLDELDIPFLPESMEIKAADESNPNFQQLVRKENYLTQDINTSNELGKIFCELPPQWSFENIYEEVDNNISLY